MNLPSPTGSGAPYWRTSCGSFQVNGHFGASNDYMLGMFIACSDGPLSPDEIRMGSDAYVYFRESRNRHSHFLAAQLRERLANPLAWFEECRFYTRKAPARWMPSLLARLGVDFEREILDTMKRLLAALDDDAPYNGAIVVLDRELSPDVMWFFRKGRLLGECAGWMA